MNVAATLARFFGRVLAPWGELGFETLLERPLQQELPAITSDAGVTLRMAGPADIDEITRLYSSDPWLYIGDWPATPASLAHARELYQARLRRGELCFMAMRGDAIVHLNWICFTWADVLPGQPIRLSPGEVFTTDALTLPAFRGHGVHAIVLHAMLSHARARGARIAYTLGRWDRTDTYKALAQLGWRERGRMIYFLPPGSVHARFLWRQGDLEPLFRPA